MTKRRRRPPMIKHLWKVTIRHKDLTAAKHRLYMTTTELWIVDTKKPAEKSDVLTAHAAAQRFLNRNRREYQICTIKAVISHGHVDN